MRRGALADVIVAAIFAAATFFPVAAVAAKLEIEGGPFLPYRFNRAGLVSEAGIRGAIEAVGIGWDGTRTPLFGTRVEASTERLEIAFYLDEDVRALEIRSDTLEGEARLRLEFAQETGFGAASDPAEMKTRRAIRELRPPPMIPLSRPPARSLSLDGLDLRAAAASAAESLFGPPYPTVALAVLALAALAFAVAPALRRKAWTDGARASSARRSSLLAIGLCSALLVAVAVAALAARKPALYVADFPTRDPSLTLSGTLERGEAEKRGYALATYAPRREGTEDIEGTARLAAFDFPHGSGLPLDEVASASARVRFSPPPMLSSRGDELVLVGSSIGWIIDAKP